MWSAIYDENCLRGVAAFDDMCYEERVLYRLLSGMRSPSSAHLRLKAKPQAKGRGEKAVVRGSHAPVRHRAVRRASRTASQPALLVRGAASRVAGGAGAGDDEPSSRPGRGGGR